VLVAAFAIVATLPPPSLPADLTPLKVELERHGFEVRLAPPPDRRVYGQFDAARNIIWVAPVAFPLGIARAAFLHEATHAAQSCPSGTLTPLGLDATVKAVVRQEIRGILTTRYGHGSRALEEEAFLLQAQPDAVSQLIQALRRRCRR
jgi:hypothetical protein